MNSVLRCRVSLVLFFLITISFLCFVIWTHFQLPERVSVHFDGKGNPNRFSAVSELTFVNAGVGVLMLLCFGVGAMLLPKVPAKYWNLPNKDYWFAPERREQAMSDVIFYYLAIGIASMLLMWGIHWSIFQVGMERVSILSFGLGGLIVYTVVILVLSLLIVFRFAKTPKD